MAPELTLEEMAGKIDNLTKLATNLKTAQDEKEKTDKEAKNAQDEEKEEERKEARKASRGRRDAAIKRAMEETDDEKKDAGIRKAQDEYDKEHKAMNKEDEKHMATDDDDDKPKHDAMTEDEKKEHDAQIASIVGDKKSEIDAKILAAAKMMNPTGVEALTIELRKNKFTASKKMLDDISKIYGTEWIGSIQNTPSIKTETPAPYFMAAAMNPQDVDKNQLNANSPDSEFAKLSTEELLKMGEN